MVRAKDVVEKILETNTKARNSDRELLHKVFLAYGLYLSDSQFDCFMKMPSMETITRIRRKLQEEGKYRAVDTVQQFRHKKAKRAQRVMPRANSDQVQATLEMPIEQAKPKRNWFGH